MKGYRTLLVNGALVVGAALLKFVADIDFSQYGVDAGVAAIIVGAANFGLRFLTSTPVGVKK